MFIRHNGGFSKAALCRSALYFCSYNKTWRCLQGLEYDSQASVCVSFLLQIKWREIKCAGCNTDLSPDPLMLLKRPKKTTKLWLIECKNEDLSNTIRLMEFSVICVALNRNVCLFRDQSEIWRGPEKTINVIYHRNLLTKLLKCLEVKPI